MFSDLSLGPLGLVQVYFVGLGPCNWVAKRVIQDLVRQNIRVLIESKAREAIRNQLRSFDILEKITQRNTNRTASHKSIFKIYIVFVICTSFLFSVHAANDHFTVHKIISSLIVTDQIICPFF